MSNADRICRACALAACNDDLGLLVSLWRHVWLVVSTSTSCCGCCLVRVESWILFVQFSGLRKERKRDAFYWRRKERRSSSQCSTVINDTLCGMNMQIACMAIVAAGSLMHCAYLAFVTTQRFKDPKASF